MGTADMASTVDDLLVIVVVLGSSPLGREPG